MAAETFDHEAVITQLEARRAEFNDATDTAIEAMRRLANLSAPGSSGVPLSGSVNGTVTLSGTLSVGPDEFYGLSVAEVVKKYLRLVRRKMTNKEIAEGLNGLGYIHNSKDLANNIGTALWRAEQADDPELFRQGRHWLLTEWTGGRKPAKLKKSPPESSAEAAPVEEGVEEIREVPEAH
jgi:hypothetical protein